MWRRAREIEDYEGAPRSASYRVCLECILQQPYRRSNQNYSRIAMLSPILRRLCVTSDSQSIAEDDIVEEPKNLKKENKGKDQVSSNTGTDIGSTDSRAISSTARTENVHQQQRRIEPRLPMSRSKSHQETMTKDEARKRMMSWRKTTRPRQKVQST